jgi:hypothetical protein
VPVVRKVWDKKADDGKGGFVEMYSMNAKEAEKNDPGRYSLDGPPPAAAPAQVRQPEAPLPQHQSDEPEPPAAPTPFRKKK